VTTHALDVEAARSVERAVGRGEWVEVPTPARGAETTDEWLRDARDGWKIVSTLWPPA
jgi:hypothetical protein